MRRLRLILAVLCCAWLGLLLAGRASAQEAISSATPIIIQDLRESAARDRGFADAEQKRADSWRDLAAKARETAAQTADPVNKQSWLDAAKAHDVRVAESEGESKRLRTQADEKEARAQRLQTAYDEKFGPKSPASPAPAQEAADKAAASGTAAPAAKEKPPECRKVLLEEAVGVWRDFKSGEPFAIVHEGGKVRLHTNTRVWDGGYNEAAPCGEPRLTFRYKPTPEEMNPEAPPWARKAVEGQLEWTIELREPMRCSGGELEGGWKPGEIAWRSDGEGQTGGAWVAGPGKERNFALERDILIEGETASAFSIAIAAQGHDDPYLNPIETMVKLERFDVLLALPRQQAKRAGTSTHVTVRNLTHPDSTTLQVTTVAALERPITIYQLTSPATIADRGQEGPRDYTVLPINPGDRISLAAQNGDLIEVSYGNSGAKAQFRLYDTWIQAGIARYRAQLEELREIYSGVVTSGTGLSPAERELAHRRLRMVTNALLFLNSPDLVDPYKYAVGEFYLEKPPPFLGATYEGDERRLPVLLRANASWYGPADVHRPAPAGVDPDLAPGGKLHPSGVVWTSRDEQEVMGVIYEARKKLKEAVLLDTAKAFTLGLYNAVAQTTGAGAILAIAGRDIFWHKLSPKERIMAAVGLASGLLLLKIVAVKLDFLKHPVGRGVGRSTQSDLAVILAKGGEKLPPSLAGKRPAPPPPAALARPVAAGAQTCPLLPAAAKTGSAAQPSRPTISGGPQISEADLAYIRAVYGDEAQPVRTTADMQAIRQSYGTCNGMTMARAFQEQTGRNLTEGDLLRLYYRLINEPGREALRAKFDARMRQAGDDPFYFDNEDIDLLVGALQGESVSVTQRSMSVNAMRAWQQRGWAVKDIIETPFSRDANHAVFVEDFATEPAPGLPGGEVVTGVLVTDSNVGWTIGVPLCKYESIRAPSTTTAGTQFMRFAPRPNVQVPREKGR